ncbi:MAG TPA: CPBP family intramembrane metalloprotease [Spirochaetales bacterium]|nr:CPBP family intramembrane metalloprotease [Spirochaetales bacterium]
MKRAAPSKGALRAPLWIAVYVVAMSAFESLVPEAAVTLWRAPLVAALSLALALALRKRDAFAFYGFVWPKPAALRGALYGLPLVALATANLWHGATLNFGPLETAAYVASMIGVGFLEETIFRGILFKELLRGSQRSAVVVSSVTFGLGHIVNLLSGAATLDTAAQVVYAIAVGFMLSVFVLRVGSIIPCIAFHSAFNSLSAFGVEPAGTAGSLIVAGAITALALGYAAFLWRLPAAERGAEEPRRAAD